MSLIPFVSSAAVERPHVQQTNRTPRDPTQPPDFAATGYAEAYDEARRRVDAIDRLVRALDDRREELALSKAELARRAQLAPEAVRRLFTVASPNPTIGTLTALADALGLELVPQPHKAG